MAVPKNIVFLVASSLSAVLLLATYFRSNLFPHGPGRPRGARYIFVDLGANRADSLEVFLQHENAKFKYDFPRPEWATHEQAGEYLDRASFDSSWENKLSYSLSLISFSLQSICSRPTRPSTLHSFRPKRTTMRWASRLISFPRPLLMSRKALAPLLRHHQHKP